MLFLWPFLANLSVAFHSEPARSYWSLQNDRSLRMKQHLHKTDLRKQSRSPPKPHWVYKTNIHRKCLPLSCPWELLLSLYPPCLSQSVTHGSVLLSSSQSRFSPRRAHSFSSSHALCGSTNGPDLCSSSPLFPVRHFILASYLIFFLQTSPRFSPSPLGEKFREGGGHCLLF